MKRKIHTILCCVIVGVLALTGCGSNSGSRNSYQIKSSTVTGTVESIDDDKITVSLSSGNMPGGMPGGQTPPEMPGQSSEEASQDNGSSQTDQQTPPEMPGQSSEEASQDSGTGQADQQAPPEKPEGEESTDSQTQPEQPEGDNSEKQDSEQSDSGKGNDNSTKLVLTIDDTSVLQDEDEKSVDITDTKEDDQLTITFDENGEVTKIIVGESEMQGGPGGQSQGAPEEYDSVNTYTEDTTIEGEEITSTGKDESAALVQNKATVTFNKVTVNRSNDESTGGDSASFYGVGAAVLTTEGTTAVKNSKITTDAEGGAGVFAYGSDSKAYVSDTTITTKQGTSGGIHVAGGGTLYAWNNTVETDGGSSAAIRSDRGGGTMVIDGGSYTSNGNGSPAVYCTADISVNDAKLTATNSEGICIEGKNSLRLYDCDLTSSQTENEQNDNIWNLIVYQSMSGDAEEGEGTLIVDGGSITAKEGGIFYTTNTQSVITVSDVEITYPEQTDYFLRCTGNSNQRGWGSAGSNGADCTFTADNQQMKGDVIYDSISDLDFYMVNGSKLTGAFIDDESCAGDGGDGTCNVVIDKQSTWIVTADSAVTSLSTEGKIVDSEGKTVTIKGTDGTVYVKGDSKYTVTTEKYAEKADTSGAQKTGSFSDYEVDKI